MQIGVMKMGRAARIVIRHKHEEKEGATYILREQT
jgi:hypothetical protein